MYECMYVCMYVCMHITCNIQENRKIAAIDAAGFYFFVFSRFDVNPARKSPVLLFNEAPQ